MGARAATRADRPTGWAKAALLFALPLALLAVLPAPEAGAATTCSYDSATKTLDVGGDPNLGTQLTVLSTTNQILVTHLTVVGGFAVSCGPTDPTTTNTETIVVQHKVPDEATQVRFHDIDEFAPGVTDESGTLFNCPSEIEIEVDLGLGRDQVQLFDVDDSADKIRLGHDGLDWGPDDGAICADLDVATPDTVDYRVLASGGADTVSARGSDATGDPLGGEVDIDGEGGRDVIRGGSDKDQLTGGPGEDKLFGMEGIDSLFAEDGTRDGKLDCGGGANSSEFAVRDGKDPQPKSC